MALPGLLDEIIRDAAAKRGDIDIVGQLDSIDDLHEAMRGGAAEVIVCALPLAALPGLFEEVLHAHPRARIVAIETDGRQSALYELRPQRTALGELSPEQLLTVIGTPPAGGRSSPLPGP